jgi:hypothetical protein
MPLISFSDQSSNGWGPHDLPDSLDEPAARQPFSKLHSTTTQTFSERNHLACIVMAASAAAGDWTFSAGEKKRRRRKKKLARGAPAEWRPLPRVLPWGWPRQRPVSSAQSFKSGRTDRFTSSSFTGFEFLDGMVDRDQRKSRLVLKKRDGNI